MPSPAVADVAIIGAGPYGLSIAAHLSAAGLRPRVFGSAMHTWRTRMPAGMHLKSEGFASSLSDPANRYPLSRFCAERAIPYADTGLPVALQTFTEYGEAFARRFVPALEDRTVAQLHRTAAGFELAMADGQTIPARRVICAAGIAAYAHIPAPLADAPRELLSHCSEHHGLQKFSGKTVAVIGGGASAADYAALLACAGATTHLLTRRAGLAFHLPPQARGLREKLRYPRSTLGAGWKSLLCEKLPLAFHALPESRRIAFTRRHLGPAPCWFIRHTVETAVSVHTSAHITAISMHGTQARLTFNGTALEVDHILAATGYKIDLRRLSFLSPALQQDIQTDAAGAPTLSAWFESSVPGLYFAGAAAANSFGPLLRFACGAQFAARRLSRHWR